MLLKRGNEYICSCYYKRNIFLRKYKLHVAFENQKSFEDEFRQILRFKGCSTDKQFQNVLDEIHEEVSKRKAIHQLVADRTKLFQVTYQRLHPNIWHLNESFFDKRFLDLFKETKSKSRKNLLRAISQNEGFLSEKFKVYQFPVLTAQFCNLLMEEVHNFRSSPEPKTRPNTMNRYGISLEEMGLSETFLIPFIKNFLTSFCAALFPSWGGASIDSFKAFIVSYDMDSDVALSDHFDNAEITINISLTENFDAGDISFGLMHGEEIDEVQRKESFSSDDCDPGTIDRLIMPHKLGQGILHCGRRTHKALPITGGSRSNLIIWMRSSEIRNNLCPMCGEPPDLISVPASGEGFTLVDVCSCT